MEDRQRPDVHDEEVRGLNINIEDAKYNKHKKRMETLELVKTTRDLKMEVQSCRVDNERMLKAQDEQNQLNTQLLQNLNHLRKKMNNRSSSRYEEGGKVHSRRENHGRS